jgi:nucleotide-binding universal stress UspA family protein
MFRKVLVPVDFTDKNRAALRMAESLVEDGGELTLLHVIETISDVPFEELEDFYQRIERRSRGELRDLVSVIGRQDVTLREEILYGRRAREIVAWSGRDGSDLIVVSGATLDPERPREDWLNLSQAVALLARCPVLLVK